MASLRTRRILGVLAAVLILGPCAAVWGIEFAGGTGTSDDPYQIATAEQLTVIGFDPALLDRHFVLVEDIDLDPNRPGGQVFPRSPIAPCGPKPQVRLPSRPPELPYGSFSGVFDGNGHVIRNLVIQAENEGMAGLFGHLSKAGEIRDLGLEGVRIQRAVAGDPAFVSGGLVAVNEGGTILRCYATGTVAGPERIVLPGGKGDIQALAASSDEIGGLVGVNNGLINTCYALVDVSGVGAVGGLIGTNSGGLIYFSFSAGRVQGIGWPGGLVGRSETSTFSRAGETISANPGTAIRCFWDIQASGILDSAAGEGRTTAEMMSYHTYASWAHTGVWMLFYGYSYPRLLWQPALGWARGGPPYNPIGTGQLGYGGGSGEPNDPYRIETAEQFLTIGCHPEDFDKDFILTADLDFNDVDHSQALPIGFDRVTFNGRFDGGSHTLSNLTISQPRALGVGVFGLVGGASVIAHNYEISYTLNGGSTFARPGGSSVSSPTSKSVINNLHLRNVSVVGRQQVGGLIGLGLGAVTDCSVDGQVLGMAAVGGLVGRSLGGDVSQCRADVHVSGEYAIGGLVGMTGLPLNLLDCRVDGVVTGQMYTGGLIGYSLYDTIHRCVAQTDVRGRFTAGGLLGSAASSTVTQSYCSGVVTGERGVGGFVGDALNATIGDSYCRADVTGGELTGGFAGAVGRLGHIDRCYAASSVTASDPDPKLASAGGFAGYVNKTGFANAGDPPINVAACFCDAEVSGVAEVLGNWPPAPANAAGLPTAQMQTAAPFLAAVWDLKHVWTICEGRDYPRLRWEGIECDE